MPYLLFIIYFIAGCLLLHKSRLLRDSGLPAPYWIIFFCIKVTAGCYYGYWYAKPKNILTSDTWRFHNQALEEYKLLLREPSEYFLNIFYNNNNYWGDVFSTHGYWNNLKDILMLKIISLMNLISGGHYYVNVVIYSFLTFFGFVFCYLACRNVLHKIPGTFTTIAILLTPSCLFWTSGLHRDGFMLLFIGLILWYATKMISRSEIKNSHILILILSVSGLFLIRNYVAILVIPPLIAWTITKMYPSKPGIVFIVMALFCIALFFLLPAIHPMINPPAKLIDRKISFEKLSGNSRLPALYLLPEYNSFIKCLPKAIDHALFRPYFWQSKGIMEKVAAIECLTVFSIAIWALLRKNKMIHPDATAFQWMILMFCITMILVIGYTIPFAGAIVRYRSVFFMLVVMISTFKFR